MAKSELLSFYTLQETVTKSLSCWKDCRGYQARSRLEFGETSGDDRLALQRHSLVHAELIQEVALVPQVDMHVVRTGQCPEEGHGTQEPVAARNMGRS